MRINMQVRIICIIFTVGSIIGAVLLDCYGSNLGSNICLAIFGSALLTYINALVTYKATRRELILRYLCDLRLYRRKYMRIHAATEDARGAYLEDISDFFYELHADYSQIQHLSKNCFVHKHISSVLDLSFQHIADIQGELNCNKLNFIQHEDKIGKSVEEVENFAKRMKYL